MSSLLPRTVPRRLIDPIVSLLARLGITPNTITVVGVVGNIGAAVLVGFDNFLAGGLLMLAASTLDMLDGALARATNCSTTFGGILDSVMDRVSEAAVLLGLLIYFSNRGDQQEVILIFLAVVGSMLVSYTRARTELAGTSMKEGYFTRAERVILLAVALILEGIIGEGLTVALWILAICSNLTAGQRLLLAWRRNQNPEKKETP